MNWVSLLFGFRGRIRRLHFWAGVGMILLVRLLFTLLAVGLAVAVSKGAQAPDGATAIAIGLVVIPLYAVLIWIGFAVLVKRCHDRGRSGLFSLLILVPIAGLIWAFIDLGCLDGTPGPNQFGASPKGIDALTGETFA